MRRRWTRALQQIERDLAAADPDLDAFFRSFASRTSGCDMSRLEKIGRKRLPVFGRPRRERTRTERTLTERMKDWCDENWNDP